MNIGDIYCKKQNDLHELSVKYFTQIFFVNIKKQTENTIFKENFKIPYNKFTS